jgi:hypothetical protein
VFEDCDVKDEPAEVSDWIFNLENDVTKESASNDIKSPGPRRNEVQPSQVMSEEAAEEDVDNMDLASFGKGVGCARF